MDLQVEFPSQYEWLWSPARYKVAHGGRWSWKSTSVAKYIALRCMEKPVRVLCAREVHKSIKESVHHLIASQVNAMGLQDCFTIGSQTIQCKNGSHIFFEGLFRNVHNIKGLDDVDICWVEEAQNVSEDSWKQLTPTIRKDGSEIIVTFNRQYLDDATDKRFVQQCPTNSVVREINYTDVYRDEEIPVILSDEIKDCLARDPSRIDYDHIYKNKPIGVGSKVWAPFDRQYHVVTNNHPLYQVLTMPAIAENGDSFMAMDPHSKYYPFCVWVALVPTSPKCDEFFTVVYNEWPTFDLFGDYYSEMRKKKYYYGSVKDLERQLYVYDGTAEYGIKIVKRFMDTRFAKGSGGENWSTSTVGIVREFAKEENGGMVFNLPAEVSIDRQRSVMIEKMQFNRSLPVSDFNRPDFYVLPHCKNVIQSLESHRCIEGTEKEDEKFKDPSDALRVLHAGIENHKYTRELVRSKSKIHRVHGFMG